MNDHYITVGELVGLVAVFVAPALLGAGIVQFIWLRKAGLRVGPICGVLLAAAVVNLVLAWGLMYVVPFVLHLTGESVLLVPALIGAVAVTVCVGLYARRRRAAA